MAKCGAGNKAIDKVPPGVRAEIDARIDQGDMAAHIYRETPELHFMAADTFEEHAKDRRRSHKVQIYRDNKAVLDVLVGLFGGREAAAAESEIESIALGTLIKSMTGADSASDSKKAIESYVAFREDKRRDDAHAMAREKFEAWRTDYLRKQEEQRKAADAETERFGRDEGLSAEQIAKIKNIYGLPIGDADDGRAGN